MEVAFKKLFFMVQSLNINKNIFAFSFWMILEKCDISCSFSEKSLECPGGEIPCNGNGFCDLRSGGICRCNEGFQGFDCSGKKQFWYNALPCKLLSKTNK